MEDATRTEYSVSDQSSTKASLTVTKKFSDMYHIQITLSSNLKNQDPHKKTLNITKIDDGNWSSMEYSFGYGNTIIPGNRDRVLKGTNTLEHLTSEEDYLKKEFKTILGILLKNAPVPEALKNHPAFYL